MRYTNSKDDHPNFSTFHVCQCIFYTKFRGHLLSIFTENCWKEVFLKTNLIENFTIFDRGFCKSCFFQPLKNTIDIYVITYTSIRALNSHEQGIRMKIIFSHYWFKENSNDCYDKHPGGANRTETNFGSTATLSGFATTPLGFPLKVCSRGARAGAAPAHPSPQRVEP